MAIAVPVLGWIGHERRETERRLVAAEELSNLMERLTVRSWDELTADSIETDEFAERLRPQLPGAALTAEVETPEEEADAKRIRLELRWRPRPDEQTSAVRLTAWTYRRGMSQ